MCVSSQRIQSAASSTLRARKHQQRDFRSSRHDLRSAYHSICGTYRILECLAKGWGLWKRALLPVSNARSFLGNRQVCATWATNTEPRRIGVATGSRHSTRKKERGQARLPTSRPFDLRDCFRVESLPAAITTSTLISSRLGRRACPRSLVGPRLFLNLAA